MTETSVEIEKRFFDELVDKSGDFNPFAERGWRTLRRCFTECLTRYGRGAQANGDMLDVGCGTGMSKQIYDGTFANYTGIDLSESAIARAGVFDPSVRWMVGDACRLPFEDNSFDVVVFSSLLHHIPEFANAVNEAFRVLRPTGVAFAFDPNLLHPAMALLRHPRSPLYLSAGVSPNERPLLPSALRVAFSNAGFASIHQHCQSDIPYREVAPRAVNLFLKTYNVGDWIWERIWLGRIFGTFVITTAAKPDEGHSSAHGIKKTITSQ